MGSVKKSIKIFARLKPTDSALCKYEVDKHINDDGSTDDILILNSAGSSAGDEYTPASGSINRPDSYKFRFSKVFDSTASQDSLFEEMCQPVLESALQGYNSTIFAYGQTGSGKTYTMTGSRLQWKNRGIIPRSLSYIFQKFNELMGQGYIASAFLSYLEIYNENGYDLLHPGFSSGRIEDLKKVQLLEDAQQQIHMKNLTVHPIKSEDEAMQLLYLGDHNRIIAETPMNEASTRSHCIFTIHLNIREGNSSTVRRSKVHLVDLAGSERLANSTNTGQLFHEARHINLALHYLEQVIVALGEAHRSHIPYRNSMMTSILRDSLGGNCMTSMVATVSLENRNILETLSTCRFSQRVALVQNAATLNEETDPMLLIAQLKFENKRLKDIITNSSIRTLEVNNEPLSQEEVADCWKLVERFMSDPDEEAILPVAKDMRMVQTCFRCLKMALQMNKDEIVGTAPSPSMVHSVQTAMARHQPTEFIERSEERYTQDMTKDQLVECLRVRDAEIDVLTKMLRPGTYSSKSNKGRFFQQNFMQNESTYENGDGPQQQHNRHQEHWPPTKMCGQYEEDRNVDYFLRGDEYQKASVGGLPPERLIQPSSGSIANNFETRETTPQCQTDTGGGGGGGREGAADDIFGSGSLFIEGLSDAKKRALSIFIRSYKGKEKLEHVRDNLLSKRSEVDSIETQLRRNHANLNNLKVVLMSSDGGGEEEDIFMREAVDVQSIQKQEKQLVRSREEMRRIEESLKGLYAHLMNDFEGYWISRKEQRPPYVGVRGIPSEVDFALGASAASTLATVQQESSNEVGAMGENTSKKPLAEMTTGIVRGVGGAYNQQQLNYFSPQKSARSKSSNIMTPIADMQFSVSLPTHHQQNPPRASKSVSGSGRRKGSKEGKQPPKNTPRDTGSKALSPRALQVPPGTPAMHILHQNQQHMFTSEQSTYSLPQLPPSSYYSQQQASHQHPQQPYRQNYRTPTNSNPQSNTIYDKTDDEDDDEELLNELPMTGDAAIDEEILSFFRTRQAVFKQIKNDKTSRIAKGGIGGSGGGVGGGVLASYQ